MCTGRGSNQGPLGPKSDALTTAPLRHLQMSVQKTKDHLYGTFVLLLLNIPVNSYGHVGTVTSNFVGLLPNMEMNDTSSPAIKQRPSKQLRLIYRDGPTLILSRLRPLKGLSSTQPLGQCVALRGDILQPIN